jgi:hypothetical protein
VFDGGFASKIVRSYASSSQKFLCNTATNMPGEESNLEQMGTLRRPKHAAIPTRAIFSPVVDKSEEMLDSYQQPRLRRPNCVMAPPRNYKKSKENLDTSVEQNESIENEDHYEKKMAETLKQMNI